jgi:hypothetical protein
MVGFNQLISTFKFFLQNYVPPRSSFEASRHVVLIYRVPNSVSKRLVVLAAYFLSINSNKILVVISVYDWHTEVWFWMYVYIVVSKCVEKLCYQHTNTKTIVAMSKAIVTFPLINLFFSCLVCTWECER